MTKNPLINALLAVLYIVLISWVLFMGTVFKVGSNSIFAPIVMLSLFTFSAAMMGLLFFYRPFILYFDGQKKIAIQLFLQTIIIFAGFTAFFLVLLFAGIFT